MGCTPCEEKRRKREADALLGIQSITVNMGPACGFNMSQLTKWKNVLDCGYTQNKLSEVNISEELYGQYIGVLNYTIDHLEDSECLYNHELALILQATHVLVALGC